MIYFLNFAYVHFNFGNKILEKYMKYGDYLLENKNHFVGLKERDLENITPMSLFFKSFDVIFASSKTRLSTNGSSA